MEDKICQKKMLEYIKKYPSGVMIPIYGKTYEYETDAFFQCIIASKEFAYKDIEIDCTNNWSSCTPGFTQFYNEGKEEVKYLRYGNDGDIEPFIIYRDYNGLGVKNDIEIVEEFRLLNNIYHDRKLNEYRDLETDVAVIRIENQVVYIDYRYLKRYLSAKNKVMLVHISSLVWGEIDKELDDQTVKLNNKIFTLSLSKANSFSKIYAKILIEGCNIEECGYWPYIKEKEYLDFLIGLNTDGKEFFYTSNPDKLQNYFGKNQDAPHYLTPIFFKPEVLSKYYNNPQKYSIEDGIIRCGTLWSIYIDNHQDDYVSAYLGDLGRDLPSIEEQQHWKSNNIVLDGKLSLTKYKRDFLAQFSEPDSPVFILQNKYNSINECFNKKFNCPLFLSLHDDDKYNLNGIRLPLNNTQPEFDMLILSLVKVFIDSLNEKFIMTQIMTKDEEELKGGISKLEKWFKNCNINSFEKHIIFLRKLQELRSCCAGHRKGKKYDKISCEFNIDNGNFRKCFRDILIQLISFLDFIEKYILI